MIIQSIQSQSIGISNIKPFNTTITASVDITGDSVIWFYPYKSSDYPEITCDKDYFFLWSTDHDQNLTGGLYWGKGNNLDLTDFEEIGLIRDGFQAETPFLYRFPNSTRPIFLYYHTIGTNPLNICAGNGQETNLMTTTGGALDSATWVDESNPFGCQGTVSGVAQSHTGYLVFNKIKGNLIGHHSFGSLGGVTYFQKSTTSDGLLWFNNNPVSYEDVEFEVDRYYQYVRAVFFERNNKIFGLINSADINDNITNGLTPKGQLHLVKADRSLNITEKLYDLTEVGTLPTSFYVNGDTAHIYQGTGRPDKPNTYRDYCTYSTFDLKPLDYL